ncbi:MAG: hypothetical protein U7127_06035 [Phormidium sp.]
MLIIARFCEALFVTNTSLRSHTITATVKQKQLLLISLIQKCKKRGKIFCIMSELSLAALCKQ